MIYCTHIIVVRFELTGDLWAWYTGVYCTHELYSTQEYISATAGAVVEGLVRKLIAVRAKVAAALRAAQYGCRALQADVATVTCGGCRRAAVRGAGRQHVLVRRGLRGWSGERVVRGNGEKVMKTPG